MKKQNGLIALFAACGIFGSAQVMADDATASSTLPEWSSYMKDLVPIGERYVDKLKDPSDPVLRQRLYMFSYEMLAQGYFNLLYQDAKHPDFWPMFNQVFPVGFANPDDSYYQALLEGDGVYKISGYRGTTYMVDFQVGSGDFTPRGEGRMGPTQANYDLDHDAHVKKDGSFEVILSPERRASAGLPGSESCSNQSAYAFGVHVRRRRAFLPRRGGVAMTDSNLFIARNSNRSRASIASATARTIRLGDFRAIDAPAACCAAREASRQSSRSRNDLAACRSCRGIRKIAAGSRRWIGLSFSTGDRRCRKSGNLMSSDRRLSGASGQSLAFGAAGFKGRHNR